MSKNETFSSAKMDVKPKALGIFGGSSSGLGVFGAIHNVCHYACQGIVALLAVFGISAVGMPLGFLLDPYLVIVFSVMGIASITLSILLHLNAKKKKYNNSCGIIASNKINSNSTTATTTDEGHRQHRLLFVDKKLLIFLALGAVSVASLVSGTNDVLAKQNNDNAPLDGIITGKTMIGTSPQQQLAATLINLDSPTKTNNEGDTSVTVTYAGISGKELVFTVNMETNNMDVPPLSDYDLKELSYIVTSKSDGETKEATPLSWAVQETGHMGHHLKGTLLFPVDGISIDGQTMRFEIVINDIAGVKQRVFSWKML